MQETGKPGIPTPENPATPRFLVVLLAVSALAAGPAGAASIDTGTDIRLDWLNEGTLSTLVRRGQARNGIAERLRVASVRQEFLSELDLADGDWGAQVSAFGWNDARREVEDQDATRLVYDPRHDGGSGFAVLAPVHADRGVELLDAFIRGAAGFGADDRVSFRLGRQVLTWGESQYFAQDAIAAGQAPVGRTVTQIESAYLSKDLFLPVGQAWISGQAGPSLAVEAYDQFEYRGDGDSVYGDTGIAAPGGAGYAGRLGLSATAAPVYFHRAADAVPGPGGQFGAALKWTTDGWDYGLYALRFDAKTPILYLTPPAAPGGTGTYNLRYPRGIELYGASAGFYIGAASFGAEISARRGMPLVADGIVVPQPAGSGGGVPGYPVADTLHLLLSWVYLTPAIPGLRDGADWTGEMAVNGRLSAAANLAWMIAGRTRFAGGFRTVFEPHVFQIVPRVDLAVPIGLGYTLFGRSPVDPTMNRGTGVATLGVVATIDRVWRAELNASHDFGYADAGPSRCGPDGSGWSPGCGDAVFVGVQRTF